MTYVKSFIEYEQFTDVEDAAPAPKKILKGCRWSQQITFTKLWTYPPSNLIWNFYRILQGM